MNNIKITTLAIITLSLTACTKDFDELNTSPILVTEDLIQPSMLFTAAQKSSIFSTYENSTFKEYSNYYSNEASGAIFQNRDWSTPFSNFQGTLINTSEVVRLTANRPDSINENAMARIWKVWLFHQLTDAYGDLPYSEAVKSMDEAINQPTYDTQKDIYTDLLNQLKDAVASLSDNADLASFGDADLLYAGNVASWIRFGNSLRLRLALRVRYADAALAGQHITDLAGKPMIENNDQNAKLTTIDGPDSDNRNPLYNDFVNSNGYPVYIGFTVTQELLKRDDPRLTIYATPSVAPGPGYRGRPMTLSGVEKVPYGIDSVAYMQLSFQQAVQTIIVMNAAEVYFLRAEAALAGLSTEDANEMYVNGIKASFEQYSVPGPDQTTYLAGAFGNVNSGTEEEKLESIIVQKYLAMFNQGAEAWAEYRRTGYPTIWTGSDMGSTNGRIPRRVTYPASEYALNSQNLDAAIGRLEGGDNMTSRIWWDAKPGLPLLHPRQGMFPPEIY